MYGYTITITVLAFWRVLQNVTTRTTTTRTTCKLIDRDATVKMVCSMYSTLL